MKIRPLGDRIVIIADASDTESAGGLILVTKANDTTETGTVVGVGPEAVEFAEGDRILFTKATGSEILIEGTTYTTLNTVEVIGIIKEDGLECIRDNIVCGNGDMGDTKTAAGIILKSNIHESQGITSRWMQVYKIGPDVDFVTVGEWVLVEYGRWTEGFSVDAVEKAYRVDPKGCSARSDEKPDTVYYNTNVIASEKKQLEV